MDITQITPPAVRSAGLVTPIATSNAVAVEQAQNLAMPGIASTSVDLSSSGRFLSLASLFQKKTLELQNAVRADADTTNALADAAVSAAAVAGAFNELQTSAVDSNGLPANNLDGQSLQSQLFQQLGSAPDDAEANLAAVGLTFKPAANSPVSELTVDDTVLQDAFRQAPGDTSALLERAAEAFLAVVGTQIQAQIPTLSLIDDDNANSAAMPINDADSQVIAAAPSYPIPQAASYTDNMFLQNLVTENVRNDGVPPESARVAAPSSEDPPQPLLTGIAPAATTITEPDPTVTDAISVAQQAQALAQQLQAEREAARELDEKIAGASDAVRAALADDIAQRDASRVGLLNAESLLAQRLADQAEPAVMPDQFARPTDAVGTATSAQSATIGQDSGQPTTPQPPAVQAPEQALLAARDPAIAAAIAAYHINTGPFAAQNGKPEMQPPKARPVAPVAAVTKVDATEALGTPGDASAPLR